MAQNYKKLGIVNEKLLEFRNKTNSPLNEIMVGLLFIQKGDSIQFVKIDNRAPKHSSCAVAYDGDMAFFLNIADEKRFTCYHKEKTVKFGDMVNLSNLSSLAISHALQGPCLVNPFTKKIAWFSVYGDVMEIYNYSDINQIKLELSNVICPPVFASASMEAGVMDPKTKLSVSSVVSDGKYICFV